MAHAFFNRGISDLALFDRKRGYLRVIALE